MDNVNLKELEREGNDVLDQHIISQVWNLQLLEEATETTQ